MLVPKLNNLLGTYSDKMMSLFFKLSLITLMLFSWNIDAAKLSDLKIICGVSSTENLNIPPDCTALTWISDEEDNNDGIKAVINLKETLPVVAFTKGQKYDKKFFDRCHKIGVDIIVLSGINEEDSEWSFDQSNKIINTIVNYVKPMYKTMLIGVLLPTDEVSVQNYIDVKKFTNTLDFVIFNTTNYRTCKYHDRQRDMIPTSTLPDIINTVNTFQGLGVSVEKMIVTISAIVNTVYSPNIGYDSLEDITYTKLCKQKLSKNRKFCYDNVNEFFDKGRYCSLKKMLGIYISDILSADPFGDCKCYINYENKYAPISIISGAFKDPTKTLDELSCKNGFVRKD